MFRNMSLNMKMMIPALVLCAVIAVIGSVGWRALSTVTTEYGRVSAVSLPRIHLTDEIFLSFRRIRITVRTLGLPGINDKEADENIAEAIKEVGHVDSMMSEYAKGPFAEGESERFETLKASWSAFKLTGAKVVKTYREGGPNRVADLNTIFFGECPENAKVFSAAIKSLIELHEDNAKLWTASANKNAADAKSMITMTLVGGLLLGLILTFATMKSVSGLIKSISTVVMNLDASASKVSEVSDSVAQTSEKLSANSTQQASALQQTTSSLEETSSMVHKNSESAKRSAEVSALSRQSAERGRESVGEVVESIREISKSNDSILAAVEESNREVSEIIKVINEIGSKTRVINDIVFQTKLLSFNASVEAARAGEHGKGFAVVAQEVGALAEMSGRSSKEISDLLDSSVTHVKSVVDKMKQNVERLVQDGTQKVQSGEKTAQRCAEVLGEIVDQVADMNSMAKDISASSQEQSKGIQEINAAVTQLDTAAQENAAASGRVSGSSTELREQVGELRALIQNLNGLVKGGAAEAA